jgi:hypothetical protein
MENLDLACTYSHLLVLMKFVKNLIIVMDKICGMQKRTRAEIFLFLCFRKLSLVMCLAKKRRCRDQHQRCVLGVRVTDKGYQ